MEADTPLDYAELQLTPRRSRCELLVSAEGVTEKLASGFCKPFVSHLRVAEVQVARGSQVIRLEQHPKFSKQTGRTWFTKGTLERFVRFVSGPEVIERVKSIEDELAQLEQVRRALASTFAQTEVRYRSIETTRSPSGADQRRDGTSIMPRRDSADADDIEPDSSKMELLRAMDVRLTALRQEQHLAFSRAAAAGFDTNNMADLMTFAEHFGGHRLGDACVQFIALLKKKTGLNEGHDEMDYPSAEAASSGSSMASASDIRTRSKMDTQRKWGPPEKLQMDYPSPTVHMLQDSIRSGNATKVNKEFACQTFQDGKRLAEDGMTAFSVGEGFYAAVNPEDCSNFPQQASAMFSGTNQGHNSQDQKNEPVENGGVFFTRPQQMAQQVGARRSGGDLGGSANSTVMGMSDQSQLASQFTATDSSSMVLEPAWNSSVGSHLCMAQASGGESHAQIKNHKVKNLPARSPFPDRGLPYSAHTAQIGSPRLWNSSSLPNQGVHLSLPQDGANKEESLKNPVKGDGSRAKDDQEEQPVSTSARRLSVQDAINLFESKKKNSPEPPVKKLVKQESRRGSMEMCNSPTFEKAVLKRWSGINSPSSGENCEQEKRTTLDSTEARKCLELDFTKDKDGAKQDSLKDSKVVHEKHIQSVVDEQEMEKHKTSLSSIVANLIRTQQPEQIISSTSSEAGVTSNNLLNGPSADLRKQFKVELMKSLTREVKNTDAVGAIISLKSEVESRNVSVTSTMKPRKDPLSEPKNESQSVVNNTISDKKVKNEEEEKANGSGNFRPTLCTSVANGPKLSTNASMEQDNAEQKTVAYSKQEVLELKESDIVKFKGMADDGNQTAGKIGSRNFLGERQQNSDKEFSADVLNTPADLHMQALIKMADDQYHDPMSLSSEESPTQFRGRFYDHYERLRDARLRGEHPAKKAEKEAKLKLMQETLERRKAEMEAKALRRPKKNTRMAQTQSGRFEKLQAQKAGLTVAQKEQEERGVEEEGTDQEDSTLQMQDQFYGYSNPASPASTPRLSNNQASTPKQQIVKKTAPTLVKPSTAHRTSTRSAAVSLPRSSLKNSAGPPNQRKLSTTSHSNTVDNSIIKSAANLNDSKKETKKPSSGRMVASAKVHPKVNGNSRIVSDAASLTDNGNITPNDDALSATLDNEEMKCQSSLVRKSCTSVSEIKTSSAQVLDVVVLESLGGQQEGVTDSMINGKLRQSAVTVSQEGKTFLRKGQGIGPGAGPGAMKQKASTPVDASKTSDGEVPADSIVNEELADSENLRRGILEEDFTKSLATDEFEGSAESDISVTSNVLVMDISNNDGSSPSVNKDQSGNIDVETLTYLAEDVSDGERVHHNTFCPDDLHEEKHPEELAVNSVSAEEDSFPEITIQKQQDRVLSASFSQLLTENNIGPLQSNSAFVTPSASIWEASLPHEHMTSPFSPAATSPANSFMPQPGTVSGHFSPPATMALDSPLGSPASWISAQSQYASEADLLRSRRQLSGPQQKPASVMSHVPKEPAKGFKRLLHFGRKSRASEMATTDCVSASTTSEGDDDAEEAKDLGSQSSDGFLRRTRMQERGFEFGNTGDHYSYQDQGAIQFLRSSIPAPPANFKLREDHLSGGTLLKAPRSFFSLSSFRSRGSEGKSR